MDKIDSWFETRPAMQHFLDPPCFVVEPIAAGHAVGGIAGTVATIPAAHGVRQMDDTLGAVADRWNGMFVANDRHAAVAAATAVRARHPGPAGLGGKVGGSRACRVVAFNMTAAGHFEC